MSSSELQRNGSVRSFGFVTSTSRRSLFADDEVNKEALNPYTTDGNSTDGEHDLEFDRDGMMMPAGSASRISGEADFDPPYPHAGQDRKSRKLLWVSLVLVVVAIVAAIVVVMVSSSGGGGTKAVTPQVSGSGGEAGPTDTSSSGDGEGGPYQPYDGSPMSPPTLSPTVAYVLPNTLPPTREGYVSTSTTASPTAFDESDLAGFRFESPEDLQAAVDAYLQCVDEYLTADACATKKIYPPDISTWNVSSIQDFSALFAAARVPQVATFNADLHQWDVSNAITMNGMFQGAHAFNGNISTWDVSNVLDLSYMFQNATSFQGDLSRWRPQQVIYTSSMFAGASQFNSDLSGWNISSIQDMSFMFEDASSFNQNLCQWGDSLDLSFTVVMSTFIGTSCESQDDTSQTTQSADGTNLTSPLCAVCS